MNKSAKPETSSGTESEQIVQVIHEAIDRFAERAVEAEHAVESYVEEHPWASPGVAFGAGILISALLRR